mmetsp:Transcript_1765/g.6450  ORF Transcript_1765/g.6450 Transcript_1765/m.6450 type:complete len:226 (-) Transcript_1765:13-690(-)
MKGERTEANLLEASKGASLPQLLRDFFESPRNASIRAVGFKTEKYLKWSREAYVKGDLYKEAPTSLFGDLGARIICLPRLNVLARAVSGQTKVGGVAQGNVTVDVECGAKRFKREFQKIDRFFDECARLGDSTHALWLPYETVKDGAPGQQDALNVVQRFLKLDVRPLAASTTQFAPRATAHSVESPAQCAEAINKTYGADCASKLSGMLFDPAFGGGGRPNDKF